MSTTGKAEITRVLATGDTKSPIRPVEAVITLSGVQLAAIAEGTNVSSWFTNLPAGLGAAVANEVYAKGTKIIVTLSGTPTAGSACLMAVTIPANVLDGHDAPVTVTPNPSAKYDITTVIKSESDLKAYAEAVNAGSYELKAKLASNKTVVKVPSGASYIPIARDKTHPYIGVFNGSGGTIEIDLTGDSSFLALFGINDGAIMNLTIAGKVTATKGAKDIHYVAAAVAYNDIHGSLDRVISQAEITADASRVGGIAGFNGWDSSGPDSPHAGDGTPDAGGYINQCRNEGNVTGYGHQLGGIAGENAGTIEECANRGTVRCTRQPGAGGIAGRNGNDTNKGCILNCYNRGTIADAGTDGCGIFGGITSWCGRFSTVQCSYASGPLPQHGSNPIIGAVHEDEEGLSDNNYALDTIFRSSTDEELTGILKTDTEMKDEDLAYDLNDADETDGVYIAVSGDYPKLKWELGITD
jgi:hypothetical protein